MKKKNEKQNSKKEKQLHAAVRSTFVDPVVASIEDHAHVIIDALGLCYEKLNAMAKSIDTIMAESKRHGKSDG